MALTEAGVEPKDVSYVETHGTGTPVGDPLEVAAVAAVYSEGREESNKLTIGSVKTNIGHTESCSGIAGIIKVVLSMQNEVIPPHKNFTKLNPAIDLECIPAQIPLEVIRICMFKRVNIINRG
jgi:acyl transferase domain-containing protein